MLHVHPTTGHVVGGHVVESHVIVGVYFLCDCPGFNGSLYPTKANPSASEVVMGYLRVLEVPGVGLVKTQLIVIGWQVHPGSHQKEAAHNSVNHKMILQKVSDNKVEADGRNHQVAFSHKLLNGYPVEENHDEGYEPEDTEAD